MDKKKRYPVNGTFELTGRCNLSCKMCLVRVDEERIKELGQGERTTEEWIDMAKQARDSGTLTLLLSGGEIMLRPDFCEIYEAISQMGFILTVYTNATMVTDKVMKVLRKHPPHKIGVTMYGASNDTYMKICSCENGYDRFVEGIRKLSTLPSFFDMRTTIIQDNREDLQAMKEFTKREFNQTLTISRFVTDAVRGGISKPKECRLTSEQNVEVIHGDEVTLWKMLKQGKIRLTEDVIKKLQMRSHAVTVNGKYMFESCGAGVSSYTITWNGNMYACGLLNQGYTDPFKMGFTEAWERLPEQYPLSHTNERCLTCEYAEMCQSCPATRLTETGEWFGIPEYSCEEAKYRYEILSDLRII